jgi:hypothetical protein
VTPLEDYDGDRDLQATRQRELNAAVAYDSGLSSEVCSKVDALIRRATAFRNNKYRYNPTGLNSNSAAHYFGQNLFPITEPPHVLGWNNRPFAHGW